MIEGGYSMCEFSVSNKVLLEFYNLRMHNYLYVSEDAVISLYKELSGGTIDGLHKRYSVLLSEIFSSCSKDMNKVVYVLPFTLNNPKDYSLIGTTKSLSSKKNPKVKALYERAKVDKRYFDLAFYCMCLGIVSMEDYFRNVRDLSRVFSLLDMSGAYSSELSDNYYFVTDGSVVTGVQLYANGMVRLMSVLFKLANDGVVYEGFNMYDFIYNLRMKHCNYKGDTVETFLFSKLQKSLSRMKNISIPEDIDKYTIEVLMVFSVCPEGFTLKQGVDLYCKFLELYDMHGNNPNISMYKVIAKLIGNKGLTLKQ